MTFNKNGKPDKWWLSMFYGGGQFQPTYLWVTILMTLIVTAVIMMLVFAVLIFRKTGENILTASFILSLLGFVGTLLMIYNWQSVTRDKIKGQPAAGVIAGITEKIKEVAHGSGEAVSGEASGDGDNPS